MGDWGGRSDRKHLCGVPKSPKPDVETPGLQGLPEKVAKWEGGVCTLPSSFKIRSGPGSLAWVSPVDFP